MVLVVIRRFTGVSRLDRKVEENGEAETGVGNYEAVR